jgi:hypothetical protein
MKIENVPKAVMAERTKQRESRSKSVQDLSVARGHMIGDINGHLVYTEIRFLQNLSLIPSGYSCSFRQGILVQFVTDILERSRKNHFNVGSVNDIDRFDSNDAGRDIL